MPAKAPKKPVSATAEPLRRSGKATAAAAKKAGVARVKQVIGRPVSPLAGIVKQIKKNPDLGEAIAKKAGIVTKTGKLAKSYA